MIIVDEYRRNQTYNQGIAKAREEVVKHKLNPNEVEATFYNSNKIAARDAFLKTQNL